MPSTTPAVMLEAPSKRPPRRPLRRLAWLVLKVVTVLVLPFVYLSRVNAKSDEIRAYYTAVHPLLRTALSTWILVDGELMVTDALRTEPDYAAMGLPVYPGSRHIRQPDGYVHAVDLRTIGRPAWRNWLTEKYFRLLGFRTLRHVGTADHLHVSLLPPETASR